MCIFYLFFYVHKLITVAQLGLYTSTYASIVQPVYQIRQKKRTFMWEIDLLILEEFH